MLHISYIPFIYFPSLALTNTVATVCNSADVDCLESYTFSPLDSLHRGPLNHVPVVNEEPLNFTTNGDNDCLNLLDAGFYHSDLNQINMCSEDCERPAKRLKMGLSEPFINDVSVNNLGVDFENHTHHITSAKMAVSVADFGSLSSNESSGFMNSHTLHQHAALQSE